MQCLNSTLIYSLYLSNSMQLSLYVLYLKLFSNEYSY